MRAIVCVDCADGIGYEGRMRWHISEDFKHFKKQTMGCPIIMGRTTWESLPAKPLPGRTNIILSSTMERGAFLYGDPSGGDFYVVGSPNEARTAVGSDHSKAWVIGGAKTIVAMREWIDEFWITKINDFQTLHTAVLPLNDLLVGQWEVSCFGPIDSNPDTDWIIPLLLNHKVNDFQYYRQRWWRRHGDV